MSQPLNPYESPREPDDEIPDDAADTTTDQAALLSLVAEARSLQPWLIGVAILTGFPGGAIATGSIGMFGISGCASLIPTGVLVLVMMAAARVRFAARALDRKATPQRLVELVNAMTFLFSCVAVLWLVAALTFVAIARAAS
jgi:hypothetical protein